MFTILLPFALIYDCFAFHSEELTKIQCANLELREQISNLKGELVKLQSRSLEYDSLHVENVDLKTIIENQQNKICEYDEEVSKTKEHMERLEILIQKIQEEKISLSVRYFCIIS